MLTVFVILAIFLQVAIALGVYFRRQRGHSSTIFTVLSLALASWALVNYVAINITQNSHTIYAIRTVISFVIIQNTLFFLFASTFPDKKVRQVKHWKPILAYSLLVLVVSQTPILFPKAVIKHGTANPIAGPAILLFVIHALITVGLGLRVLYVNHKHSAGTQKRQYTFILFASIILWLITPVTNFILTLGLETTLFVKFSPFYTLIFGALITYAIVAQKLFDIRAAVARSVAYVLILGSMTIGYGIIIFGVIDVIFRGQGSETLRQGLSVVLIMPFALSFQHIKGFFDKISNKLFYRDAYDSQEILDKIGNIIITELELSTILNDVRTTLNGAFHASLIEFILYNENNSYYIEGHHDKTMDQAILGLSTEISKQHKELFVVDEAGANNPLQVSLSNSGVALSLRLKTNKQLIGYIVFGDKQSGNIYTNQDKKLLLIVANEIAVAIQNSLRFEQIKQFNVTLQGKVNEATKQLRKTNDKLRALDESKDEFISMASHQLRTPLTSVKGYVSMVLDGDAGKVSGKQKDLLHQAFISSQRMVDLIADLLNVSRLRTGKFIIESKPTDLNELIEGEINQLIESAKAKNIELTYEKPKDFPILNLDETKIRQVIMNFADNAIYYTPKDGHIKLSLINKPEVIEFTVADDGIGVPRSEQHHLFTKFYRANNARQARPDGTGLGLFMAKKVVVAEGGSIIFESEENKGSTFGFTFSKSKMAVPKSKTPLIEKKETTK